jgi:hypothetical protein
MDNWRLKGACRVAPDPDLFFNGPLEKARLFCSKCPVKALCAEQGESEKFGIWGGAWWWQLPVGRVLTYKQRRYYAKRSAMLSMPVIAEVRVPDAH